MGDTLADRFVGAVVDGRYRVLDRIATGGMASVYEAVDERLERLVALKIISESRAGSPAFLAAFEREAKTAARLAHPNVVAVYDQGSHDGLPYVVMEHVAGHTLRDVLNRRGRLPVGEALRLCRQMLDGLHAAHRIGLVHRDVKPENILIAERGGPDAVKVADFGLAQAIQAGSEADGGGPLLATVAYVAPELVAGGRADTRSDVYSCGIMLFEMLTGTVPFDGPDTAEVAAMHLHRDVPPPSSRRAPLPSAVEDLVVRATRRAPEARPADAADFAGELSRMTESHVIPAPPAIRALADRLPMRQRSVLVSLLTILAVLIVALVLTLVAITGWWLAADHAASLIRTGLFATPPP